MFRQLTIQIACRFIVDRRYSVTLDEEFMKKAQEAADEVTVRAADGYLANAVKRRLSL